MMFHLVERDAWTGATSYRPESLESEGFIHCSNVRQVTTVANERFFGRKDLLIITIDRLLLDVPVVCEDSHNTGQRFPHVYGRLNDECVVDVEPFEPDANGEFGWPPGN